MYFNNNNICAILYVRKVNNIFLKVPNYTSWIIYRSPIENIQTVLINTQVTPPAKGGHPETEQITRRKIVKFRTFLILWSVQKIM